MSVSQKVDWEICNGLLFSYDEDRWPSGSAGGKVIKQNPEHKGKHILFTRHAYGTVDLGGYVKLLIARSKLMFQKSITIIRASISD